MVPIWAAHINPMPTSAHLAHLKPIWLPHGCVIWVGDIGEQNYDFKHKQSQLIGMDSVTDICKYHFLCFVTIIKVKVISGHQVKKVKQTKNRDLELRYMFLGQIFTKNAKMTLKHFLKRQNRSKNKIRKITVKSAK